jgi:hypothetical protein
LVRPGEGERRAATGYRAQYRIAAELVLANLRELEWIKVADPEAGQADDFQLATSSNVLHALQVKWSAFPSSLTFTRLIGGSDPLIRGLAEAWGALRANNPGRTVRVHLVSNNVPSTADSVQPRPPGSPAHFAAFLRLAFLPIQRLVRHDHEANVVSEPAFTEWDEAWAKLLSACGLEEQDFWAFVADFDLNLGVADNAFTERGRSTPKQLRDLAHLAAVLFDIVADPERIVRLTRAELIEKLGWTRRLSYRNRHVFPVPSAYEPNEVAVSSLLAAIESHSGGYLGLVAAAGAGKSTLLTATELPAKRAVHYYAFTPEAPDPSTGRGESENFFFDVVGALDDAGLFTPDVLDPTDRLDLKQRLLNQIDAAHQEWLDAGHRTIIIVDGLDHIPREQNPHRSLIDDLPDPSQLTEGVYIIVGTQTTNVLPPAIRNALGADDRTIEVPPLTPDEVLTVATNSGPGTWLEAEQKQALVDAAEGHPLALTYLIEELNEIFIDPGEGPSPEALERVTGILSEGAEYGGDVQARYEGYWECIAEQHDLHELLGVTARLRSRISLDWLLTWSDATTVDRFAQTASPFFIKDDDSWTFIHNSFRLFLRTKTAMIGGTFSEERNRQLHGHTAEICAHAAGRWISYRDEELAQRLHASQHEQVLELASPERLRARLNELAPPGAIALDVDLALQSAAALSDAVAVVKLALMKFELELRNSVLEPHEVAFKLIRVGEHETALRHIVAGRDLRIDPVHALQAAVAFLKADRVADAGEIIRIVGPLRALIETTQPRRPYESDTASLIQWWVAAHARTRRLEEVLGDIDRHLPQEQPDEGEEADVLVQYRAAALWQLAHEAAAIDDPNARSKVILAASESDPLAAASAELSVETDGSTETLIDRVESALAHFGITNTNGPGLWTAEELNRVPGRVRLRGAELLVEVGAPVEMARTLVAGYRLPTERQFGDEERRNLWRAYRLHRIRHIVGLEAECDTTDPTDAGLALFGRALRQLAELDASVWKSRGQPEDTPVHVMTTARQLHRLYEIPARQRRGWTSWYVAQGAAPEFLTKLIEVATVAGEGVIDPRLTQLFLDAWSDPERAGYWSYAMRIAVLRALGRAGMGVDKVVAELDAISVEVRAATLEAYERTETLLELSATLSDFGARDQALRALRATVQGSLVPGAHDKDHQLEEWVLRFGEFTRAVSDTETARRETIIMVQRVAWAKIAGASTDSAAESLLRIAFAVDPGLAVDMADWFMERDVLDGPDALAGLVAGAAEDLQVAHEIVTEAVRSIYMPAALHQLPDVVNRLLDRGGEAVRLQLEDGVRRWVLPSFRAGWGEAVSRDALAPPAPWIGDAPVPSEDEATGSEPTTFLLADGRQLSELEAAERVSSKRELFQLLERTVAPVESYRTTPVSSALRKVVHEVEPSDLDLLLDELPRVRSDSDSYAALAADLITRWGVAAAKPVIARARRAITMRGWSDFWDGGTRRKFWEEAVAAGGHEVRREAIADLATALRVGAVYLSALVHDLPSVIRIIGLDAVTAWPAINDYLTVLCQSRGDSEWEPTERSESGTLALLRHTIGYAGHPVRTLEWGARNVLRSALTNPETASDAALVIAGTLGQDAAADEVLWSVVRASAADCPIDLRETLRDPVRAAAHSEDQIVRDLGLRAAEALGVELDVRAKRPLPLSFSLAVPPLPPRSAPVLDDEGVAVLDPLNPRSHLSTYDMLLEGPVARLSGLEPATLIRQAGRLADRYAESARWTRGGVKAHARRIKSTGWLQSYRPWALMVGRRGASTVLAQLTDARRLPNPKPLTLSEGLEMVDFELEYAEPEALPTGVPRPARRDRFGADTGDWVGDTADAARVYASTQAPELVAGEWMNWTEYSWNLGRERRVSAIRFPTGELLGASSQEAVARAGALHDLEKAMSLNAFETAGGYRRYVASDPEPDDTHLSLVVGGLAWWAELRWGAWLAFNPEIALALGWRLSDSGLFRWVDDTGEEMARSRWWTQGLTTHQPPHFEDDAAEGWQVLLASKGWQVLTERFGAFERWSVVARAIKNREEMEGDVLTIKRAEGREATAESSV